MRLFTKIPYGGWLGKAFGYGVLCFSVLVSSGCSEKPKDTPKPPTSAETISRERLNDATARSLTFRDLGGKNFGEALDVFRHAEFEPESPVLDPNKAVLLQVFFRNAYPVIGAVDSRRSVIGFLNPYLDLFASSSWEDGKLRSLAIHRGETFLRKASGSTVATPPRYTTENSELTLSERMIISAKEVRDAFVENQIAQGDKAFSPPGQDNIELEAVWERIRNESKLFMIFAETPDYVDVMVQAQQAVAAGDLAAIEKLAQREFSESEKQYFEIVAETFRKDEFNLGHVTWSTDGSGLAIVFLTGRYHTGCAILLPLSVTKAGTEEEVLLRSVSFVDLVSEPDTLNP